MSRLKETKYSEYDFYNYGYFENGSHFEKKTGALSMKISNSDFLTQKPLNVLLHDEKGKV